MNRERLIQLMREHEVGTVVAATPPNVAYLTGHLGWAQYIYRPLPCLAAFTDDGSPGTDLVVPRSDTPYHAAFPSRAERVAAYGGRAGLLAEDPGRVASDEEIRFEHLQDSCAEHRTPLDAISDLISARAIAGRRVLVDDPTAVPGLVERLQGGLPGSDVVAGEGLFLMSRLVKTAEEIEGLRVAAQVNEDALDVAMEVVAEGAKEAAVAATWRREIAAAGAKPLWFHLGSGRRSAYVFPPTDKTFQAGELFMLDAGLIHDGMLADTGLCGSIGEPSHRARAEYEACRTAFEASESVISEGVLPSTIFEALSGGLSGTVLEGVTLPFAGHTIGYDAREFPFVLGPPTEIDQPFLPRSSDIPLPANSTINVEIPLGRLGWGGYQIEKTYVVTEGGYEPILDYERDLIVR